MSPQRRTSMKVRAIKAFQDLTENTSRKVGEEWECADARAYALANGTNPSGMKLAEIVEEKTEEEEAPKKVKNEKKK